MQHNVFSVKRLISKMGFIDALWFLSSEESSKTGDEQFGKSALIRLISNAGIQGALVFLGASDFPEAMKDSLAKDNYFVGGYPNVELISTLA